MSLIKCTECGQDISDQAPSCPHCGLPLSAKNLSSVPSEARKVDLNVEKFEMTSKKWKKYLMFAIPLLVIGLPLFFFNLMIGMTTGTTSSSAGWFFLGLVFTVIGGILFLISAIGNWWERG